MSSSAQLFSPPSRHSLAQLVKKFHKSACLASKGQVDVSSLEIRTAGPGKLHPKPAVKDLVFGKQFTDHMLRIPWSAEKGWSKPSIVPLEPFKLHPGAKVRQQSCRGRIANAYFLFQLHTYTSLLIG